MLLVPALKRLAHAGEGTLGVVIQMPVLQRVIIDTVGGSTLDERLAFEFLNRAAVAYIRAALEGFDIKDRAGFQLHLYVPRALGGEMLHVLIREMQHSFAAFWDDPAA